MGVVNVVGTSSFFYRVNNLSGNLFICMHQCWNLCCSCRNLSVFLLFLCYIANKNWKYFISHSFLGRKWQPTPVFLSKEFHDREAWWAIVYEITKSKK